MINSQATVQDSLLGPNAGRRTVFWGRKSNDFFLKQISTTNLDKSQLHLTSELLISKEWIPPLQSLVNQYFSQTFVRLYSRKNVQSEDPMSNLGIFPSFLELKWVWSTWLDYWIYSNITWNTKEMCFEEICFKKIFRFSVSKNSPATGVRPNRIGLLSLWSEDCFYYCSERNNVVVLFGTLKVQSFILTEVSDCGLLIVITSSTFLKRKDMLKEKSS